MDDTDEDHRVPLTSTVAASMTMASADSATAVEDDVQSIAKDAMKKRLHLHYMARCKEIFGTYLESGHDLFIGMLLSCQAIQELVVAVHMQY